MPPLSPERARRFYDRLGGGQDWQRFYEDTATRLLLAWGGFGDAEAVLELGCGTGRFAETLLARHLPADARYTGIDLSPRMVDLTRARLARWRDRADLRVGTAADAGAGGPDGTYDRVVANYVFDLLGPDETDAVLGEAHHLLRPGGRLCATGLTFGINARSRAVARAWSWLWRRAPGLVGGCRPIRLTDALEPAAWRVERHETVTAWAVPSEVVVAVRS